MWENSVFCYIFDCKFLIGGSRVFSNVIRSLELFRGYGGFFRLGIDRLGEGLRGREFREVEFWFLVLFGDRFGYGFSLVVSREGIGVVYFLRFFFMDLVVR